MPESAVQHHSGCDKAPGAAHWFGPKGPSSKGKGHPLMFGFILLLKGAGLF